MEKRKVFAWILFISLLVFAIVWYNVRIHQITKHLAIADATIVDCNFGGKDGGTGVYYDFKVRDKKYTGWKKVNSSYFECEDKYIGKTYKVAYDSTDPHISELLMNRKDYNRYGLIYPTDTIRF